MRIRYFSLFSLLMLLIVGLASATYEPISSDEGISGEELIELEEIVLSTSDFSTMDAGDPECTSQPSGDCKITQDLTIDPGEYTITGTMDILASDVTVDCQGATINFPTASFNQRIFDIYRLDNIIIKNCILETYEYGIGVAFRGVSYDLNDNIQVLNNTFYGFKGMYGSHTTNALVKDNKFIELNSWEYAMKFWNLQDSVIDGNLVDGVMGNDIQFHRGENTVISNNEFKNFFNHSSLWMAGSSDNVVVNNTFYHNNRRSPNLAL
jgi:hypothetical protein